MTNEEFISYCEDYKKIIEEIFSTDDYNGKRLPKNKILQLISNLSDLYKTNEEKVGDLMQYSQPMRTVIYEINNNLYHVSNDHYHFMNVDIPNINRLIVEKIYTFADKDKEIDYHLKKMDTRLTYVRGFIDCYLTVANEFVRTRN